MPIPRRAALLLMLPLALAACESGTDPDEALTSAEAQALAGAILGLTLDAGFAVAAQPQATGPAAAPVTIDSELAFDAPCPLGGEVGIALSMEGTVDDETQVADFELTLDQEHRGCGVEAESGQRFTLDGAPGVGVAMHLTVDADLTFSISGTFSGAVDWQTDDRSGNCGLNLEFSATGTELSEEGSSSLSGTVCGVTVSHVVSQG